MYAGPLTADFPHPDALGTHPPDGGSSRNASPHPGAPPGGYAEHLADLFTLLSDPARLRVMLILAAEGEAAAGDLAARMGAPPAATGHHLSMLRLYRLVHTRRQGKRVFYRPAVGLTLAGDQLHIQTPDCTVGIAPVAPCDAASQPATAPHPSHQIY